MARGRPAALEAIIAGAACLALGLLRFLADLPDPWAPSMDSLYYALQTQSVMAFGEGFFADPSPVAPLAAALSGVSGMPVLASLAVLAGIFAAGSAAGLILSCVGLSRLLSPDDGGPPGRSASFALPAALALLAVAGRAQSYLAREFLKNSLGQALFLLGLGLLLAAAVRAREGAGIRTAVLPRAAAAIALITGAGLVHRLYAGLAAVCAVGAAAGYALSRLTAGKRGAEPSGRPYAPWLSRAAVPATALAAIGLIAALLAGSATRELGGDSRGLVRFAIVARAAIPAMEKWEHAIAFLSLVLWIPAAAAVLRRAHPGGKRAVAAIAALAAAHAACVLPLTGFGWDLLSYRLMLAAPPFAALAAAALFAVLPARPRNLAGPLVSVPALALAAWLAAGSSAALEPRRPPYGLFAADLAGLRDAVPAGWSVLAARGLAGFIWYELGVPSENFEPAADSPRKYARLAWGTGPAMYRDDDGPDGSPPLRFGPWTLVAETAWDRLRAARPNLLAVRGGRNDLPARPADSPAPRYGLFDLPLPRKSADANLR